MEPSGQRFLLNLASYLPRLHRSAQGKYFGGGKVSLGADNLPARCQGQRREEGEASGQGEGGSAEHPDRDCPVNNGEATGQAVVWGFVGECMEYNVKGLPCRASLTALFL